MISEIKLNGAEDVEKDMDYNNEEEEV